MEKTNETRENREARLKLARDRKTELEELLKGYEQETENIR